MKKTPARDMAEQMLLDNPDQDVAIYTDLITVPSKTIVGIAVRGRFSTLLTVDAAEWNADWAKNLALLDSVSPATETHHDPNAEAFTRAVRLPGPRPAQRAPTSRGGRSRRAA